jgi:hypothetical protein
MTTLEASAMLYRAMLYTQDMAYKQRTDDRRRAYNAAFDIMRDARGRIE